MITGALENAGLGEFAYYMKKAGQYTAYAEFALDNTNFDALKGRPTEISEKIVKLRKMANELIFEINNLPAEASEATYENDERNEKEGGNQNGI